MPVEISIKFELTLNFFKFELFSGRLLEIENVHSCQYIDELLTVLIRVEIRISSTNFRGYNGIQKRDVFKYLTEKKNITLICKIPINQERLLYYLWVMNMLLHFYHSMQEELRFFFNKTFEL